MLKLQLVKAIEEDYDFYYHLKCEKSNIYWAGHTSPPNYKLFKEWYDENVLSGKLSFYILKQGNEKVGVVYYTFKSDDYCEYLGLAISEKYQGRGLSKIAVEEFIKHIEKKHPQCHTIGCFIRVDNVVSKKLHQSMGFVETKKSEARFVASENKNIEMVWLEYYFNKA